MLRNRAAGKDADAFIRLLNEVLSLNAQELLLRGLRRSVRR